MTGTNGEGEGANFALDPKTLTLGCEPLCLLSSIGRYSGADLVEILTLLVIAHRNNRQLKFQCQIWLSNTNT